MFLGWLGCAFRIPLRLGDAFKESLRSWECLFKNKIDNPELLKMQYSLSAKKTLAKNISQAA